MHTAFHKEDELGDPVAQDQLGAMQETPITSESEAGRLVEEDEKKDFNRRKMGGFLMELGLNILSSNRDDAGAAVGDAFGKTRADRTARKQASASEELAKQERERKQRREDESDTLKQEKADREVKKAERDARKEGRDISSADRNKLKLLQKDDGTYEYVDIKKGRVYDAAGKELRGVQKSDSSNALTVGQEAIQRRDAQKRLDDKIKAIRENPTTEEDEALGFDSTDAEITKYAISQLGERDRQLFERNPPDDIKDYDELTY